MDESAVLTFSFVMFTVLGLLMVASVVLVVVTATVAVARWLRWR